MQQEPHIFHLGLKQINFEIHSGYGGPLRCVPVNFGAFRSIPVRSGPFLLLYAPLTTHVSLILKSFDLQNSGNV